MVQFEDLTTRGDLDFLILVVRVFLYIEKLNVDVDRK